MMKQFFEKGLISSLQSTIVIPYPGTRLFKECSDKDLLRTKDWDRFDMKETVMKSPLTTEELAKLRLGMYRTALSPGFIANKVLSVRSTSDIKFLFNGGMRVDKVYISSLKDFCKFFFSSPIGPVQTGKIDLRG
jgi:anaerobic magnesium-protoporphyrin IX monomethyl ester cyclase